MRATDLGAPDYWRELGDGLLLRWSTAVDGPALADLYQHVFRDTADEPLNQRVTAWLGDMLSGRHPLVAPTDFALVEETSGGRIVAATALMRQQWEYAGIAFPVGRPEIVATRPEYHRRGLVRAIFGLIHARSDSRGDLAQGITGIPYFYRQFGYEYALDLGGGYRLPLSEVPPLKPDEREAVRLREAEPGELPRLAALYDRHRAGALVSAVVDDDYWHWTLTGQSRAADAGFHIQIIAAVDDDRPLGVLLSRHVVEHSALMVDFLGLEPGVALPPRLPSLLRALRDQAATVPPYYPERASETARQISFRLGRADPLYPLLERLVIAQRYPPYAWYVRVPDLPALLRRLAPVLEARLAASLLAGHSGELRLTFYRGGLRLAFADGRLTVAEPWHEVLWQAESDAGFPPLVFLQLLFGHRGLSELRGLYPDVRASGKASPLLEVLFPPRLAWVLPLD